MATINPIAGTEKIKDSYGKINDNFAALNDAKLEKSGDTMSGELTVDYPNNGGFARIGIRNIAQTLDLAAYWEAGVTQFAQVQSWDIVDNAPRLLRLNPLGGPVSINDYVAWHNGNNPASLATNGYQIFASGVIIQWGTTPDIDPSTTGEIVFPVVFPNACFVVLATVESWPDVAAAVVSSISTNVCGVNHNASTAKKIRWIAVGY